MNFETLMYGLKQNISQKRFTSAVVEFINAMYSGKMKPEEPLIGDAIVQDVMQYKNWHNDRAIIQAISMTCADAALSLHMMGMEKTWETDPRVQEYLDITMLQAQPFIRQQAAKLWGPDPCIITDLQVTALGKKLGYIAAPPAL